MWDVQGQVGGAHVLNLHLKPVFEPAMFGLEHAPGSTPPAHPQAQASHADCCPPSESHTAPSQPDSHVQVPGAVQLPWTQEGEHTAAQGVMQKGRVGAV